jgi:DNA gyrase subunit B
MYELVSKGHIYVAQPPLFRVRSKKDTYYVQTEEEMKTQLLDQGLGDSVLDAGDGRVVEGEQMTQLARTLAAMEESLVALDRRGVSLRLHAVRQDPVTLKLPVYHVFIGNQEHWLTTREQLDELRAREEEKAGGELAVGDAASMKAGAEGKGVVEGNGQAARTLTVVELHEVKTINNMLTEMAKLGFSLSDLIPQERTGTETPRFELRRGEHTTGLEDLRGLLPAIRAAGEKGLTITRFKGLGEMNAEELRDTTLDPANRTLSQVTMQDAGAADELFRILMGDKVEPRREFIEKHALEVRNLDV